MNRQLQIELHTIHTIIEHLHPQLKRGYKNVQGSNSKTRNIVIILICSLYQNKSRF